MKIRMMLNHEWDRLVALTSGDNAKIHWKQMFSWVNNPEHKNYLPKHQEYRGYESALYFGDTSADSRGVGIGFRPACIQTAEALRSVVMPKEGECAVIGTLYMNGEPVKVPQNPTGDGDVEDYIPGASLKMREPLENPAYQVTGIRVGDVFIADRNLLKCISYEDIERATSEPATPPYGAKGFFFVDDIHGGVYCAKTSTGRRFLFVADELSSTVKDLANEAVRLNICRAIVELERKGYIITSVNRLEDDGTIPRLAFRKWAEYKQATKE